MFYETDRLPERLSSKIINGSFSIVELTVRNPLEVRIDQVLDHAKFLPDGRGANLLVISDHNDTTTR